MAFSTVVVLSKKMTLKHAFSKVIQALTQERNPKHKEKNCGKKPVNKSFTKKGCIV